MKFDYTHGMEARYTVGVYKDNTNDHYYFHGYYEAKKFFDKVKGTADSGTSISLYDMVNDIRKVFHKGGKR